MTETAVRQPPRSAQLRWAGPLAIGIGVAVNGALFLIAEAFGVFPADVVDPGSGRPFALTTVVIATAVGAFGATVTYAVLDRFLNDADRWFRIIAVVVLLASFATPFTIPGAPPAMIGLLLGMHTVVAGVSVWLFTVRGVD